MKRTLTSRYRVDMNFLEALPNSAKFERLLTFSCLIKVLFEKLSKFDSSWRNRFLQWTFIAKASKSCSYVLTIFKEIISMRQSKKPQIDFPFLLHLAEA